MQAPWSSEVTCRNPRPGCRVVQLGGRQSAVGREGARSAACHSMAAGHQHLSVWEEGRRLVCASLRHGARSGPQPGGRVVQLSGSGSLADHGAAAHLSDGDAPGDEHLAILEEGGGLIGTGSNHRARRCPGPAARVIQLGAGSGCQPIAAVGRAGHEDPAIGEQRCGIERVGREHRFGRRPGSRDRVVQLGRGQRVTGAAVVRPASTLRAPCRLPGAWPCGNHGPQSSSPWQSTFPSPGRRARPSPALRNRRIRRPQGPCRRAATWPCALIGDWPCPGWPSRIRWWRRMSPRKPGIDRGRWLPRPVHRRSGRCHPAGSWPSEGSARSSSPRWRYSRRHQAWLPGWRSMSPVAPSKPAAARPRTPAAARPRTVGTSHEPTARTPTARAATSPSTARTTSGRAVRAPPRSSRRRPRTRADRPSGAIKRDQMGRLKGSRAAAERAIANASTGRRGPTWASRPAVRWRSKSAQLSHHVGPFRVDGGGARGAPACRMGFCWSQTRARSHRSRPGSALR